MRVLLHCVYYPPEVGGLESHVSGLAEGLVRHGAEVRVVTSRSISGLPREEEVKGVRVKRTWLPSRSPLGWAAHALCSAPATRRWAKWADLIHAQSFASVPPVVMAARAEGCPSVGSFHTSHFLLRAESRLWAPVLTRLVEWPDHVLAASEEIAEVASDLGRGSDVEALTNGVDTDQFRALDRPRSERETAPTIVVPRRLFQKNGVEFLVRALPAIRAGIPDVRVIIVGDGPERRRLEEVATQLGVEGSIEFLGSRPHEEMPDLLSAAKIAVFPSLMEATSVAALEAMSCGLPVVASDVGGLPEIVDSEVGMLVPPGDSAALAAGVIRLLSDERLSERGRRARDRVVANWSNDRLIDRHLEIYGDLLEGRAVRKSSAVGGG